jgi:hypothetical protein
VRIASAFPADLPNREKINPQIRWLSRCVVLAGLQLGKVLAQQRHAARAKARARRGQLDDPAARRDAFEALSTR